MGKTEQTAKQEKPNDDLECFLIGLVVLAVIIFGVVMIPVGLILAGVFAILKKMLLL